MNCGQRSLKKMDHLKMAKRAYFEQWLKTPEMVARFSGLSNDMKIIIEEEFWDAYCLGFDLCHIIMIKLHEAKK